MDEIKRAFQKVKEDMGVLNWEIGQIRQNLEKNNEKIKEIAQILEKSISTNTPQNSTDFFDTSTHPYQFKPLKPQNLGISTGNQGASTDRQTDRHIDRQIFPQEKKGLFLQKMPKNTIDEAAEILDSLDSIKKQIRLQFKQLTTQEILIFSTIYQLEEEQESVDYKSLANKLSLTESSIRDYVGRLIKKGIPVEKKKIKNKNIQLSISPNLKKIATLSTILQLRDL